MRARNVLVIATALLAGCAFDNGGNNGDGSARRRHRRLERSGPVHAGRPRPHRRDALRLLRREHHRWSARHREVLEPGERRARPERHRVRRRFRFELAPQGRPRRQGHDDLQGQAVQPAVRHHHRAGWLALRRVRQRHDGRPRQHQWHDLEDQPGRSDRRERAADHQRHDAPARSRADEQQQARDHRLPVDAGADRRSDDAVA